MTRPWGRIYANMLTHSKYIQSNHEQRSAQHTLFLSALSSPRDDDLGNEREVACLLRMYGHKHPVPLLAEMVELGWLDLREGHYYVHDFFEHQPADPTGAERKRQKREAANAGVLGRSADKQRTVRGRSVESPRGPRDMSNARGEESREEENLGGESRAVRPAHAPVADDADPAFALRQWLAAHNAPVHDGDGYHAKLCRLVAIESGKTIEDVLQAFEQLHTQGARTSKQLVMGAEDLLFPMVKAKGKAERRPLSEASQYDAGMDDGSWVQGSKS